MARLERGAARARAAAIVASGRGATCANSARASRRASSSTASVMRSWISGSSAARSLGAQAAPSRVATRYSDAALDAHDRVEPAVARDVGGLRRPRRDRAGPRHDEQQRCLPSARVFDRAARRSAAVRACALARRRADARSRRSASTSRRCRRCGGRDALRRGVAAAWRGGTAKAPSRPPAKGCRPSKGGGRKNELYAEQRAPRAFSDTSGQRRPADTYYRAATSELALDAKPSERNVRRSVSGAGSSPGTAARAPTAACRRSLPSSRPRRSSPGP